MRGRRFISVLSVGAAALLVAAGAGTADAAPTNWLKTYQAQFQDPQADLSGVDIPPPAGTDAHSGHHGSSTTGEYASGFTALPPETGGQWDYLPSFPPEFNALHVVAGPNGKILLVAGSGKNKANFTAGTFTSYIWNPVTDERRLIPTPSDMFCAGHTLLPDGRALVGGGTSAYGPPFKGSKALYAFNFTTEQYELLPPLEVGRWYPTAVTGADGRVLFVAGFDENGIKTNVTESFDYRTNTHVRVPSLQNLPNYVHLHVASNSKFFVGNSTKPGFWDPYANTFTQVNGFIGPKLNPSTSASCFVGDVRDQNLMMLGGGWPATNITRIIDLDAPTPTYRQGPSLLAPKGYVGCVNLPDGTLFEANGGSANAIAGASTEAAILTDVNAAWTPVNPLPSGEHRLYHSLLFLLDSGQVISTTSNPKGEARNNSVLIYTPPYLFHGTRPVITAAPVEVAYGGTYAVNATATGATVDRFTLTTPSSPTHSLDSNQRYVSLPVTAGNITIPTSSAILPPGWYRLWAVDSLGRPSVAKWIHLS